MFRGLESGSLLDAIGGNYLKDRETFEGSSVTMLTGKITNKNVEERMRQS